MTPDGLSPVMPDYRRPEMPEQSSQGLPLPGWPMGTTWIAYVGQPVGGAVGGIAPTPKYENVVEVVARTGTYHPAWHEGGIPQRNLQQLTAERTVRQDFLSAWRYRASLWEVYVAVRSRGSHIVDHMKRDYLSRGGWISGVRVPPPPPPPPAGARGPCSECRCPGRANRWSPPRSMVWERHRHQQGRAACGMLKPPSRCHLLGRCPMVHDGTST